jgi:hypothetical protein
MGIVVIGTWISGQRREWLNRRIYRLVFEQVIEGMCAQVYGEIRGIDRCVDM